MAAPVLTVSGAGTSFLLGTEYTLVDPKIEVSDPDSPNLQGGEISIENPETGDFISFSGIGSIEGELQEDGTTIILSGSGTVEQYQTALRTVKFSTTSEVTTARTISYVVNDGELNSNQVTRFVHIAQANPGLELSCCLRGHYRDQIVSPPGWTLSTWLAHHQIGDLSQKWQNKTVLSDWSPENRDTTLGQVISSYELGMTVPTGNMYRHAGLHAGATTRCKLDIELYPPVKELFGRNGWHSYHVDPEYTSEHPDYNSSSTFGMREGLILALIDLAPDVLWCIHSVVISLPIAQTPGTTEEINDIELQSFDEYISPFVPDQKYLSIHLNLPHMPDDDLAGTIAPNGREYVTEEKLLRFVRFMARRGHLLRAAYGSQDQPLYADVFHNFQGPTPVPLNQKAVEILIQGLREEGVDGLQLLVNVDIFSKIEEIQAEVDIWGAASQSGVIIPEEVMSFGVGITSAVVGGDIVVRGSTMRFGVGASVEEVSLGQSYEGSMSFGLHTKRLFLSSKRMMRVGVAPNRRFTIRRPV